MVYEMSDMMRKIARILRSVFSAWCLDVQNAEHRAWNTDHPLLMTVAMLLVFFSAKGQTTTPPANPAPIDVYVSKQGGNPKPLYNGGYTASADEGREISIQINGVKGPITVNPMTFDLKGPPCPTYDAHGKRTPTDPVAPNTKDFAGEVILDESKIPAPGTTETAEFTAKDNGFWTKCSKNEKVPYNDTRTATFNIISIKIELAEKDAKICNDAKTVVKVKELYPASGGTVTWASLKGKFEVTGDNTQATLTGKTDGDDELEATYTVGKVNFKVKIPVRVNVIKFKETKNVLPWYAGGKKDGTTLLTDASNKTDLEWTMSAGAAKVNANTGEITYPAAAGGTYTLTAASKKDNTCKATTTVIFMGYDVLVKNTKNASECDGTENIPVKVVPIPATLDKAELAKFGVITISSETKMKNNGNEEGTDVLDIPALDANYETKIKKAIWYSTINCNFASVHKIKGEATVDGNAVNTPLPGKTDAQLTSRIDCINGRAQVATAFAGAPNVVTGVSPRNRLLVRAVIGGVGNFRRAVVANATWWGPDKSQFMPFVKAEENFHKTNQLENPAHAQLKDLYDPARVMVAAATLWWDGPNAAVSTAQVLQAFTTLCNAEILRSNNFFGLNMPRRCAIEKEAKDNTKIKFGFHMKCAYPGCK